MTENGEHGEIGDNGENGENGEKQASSFTPSHLHTSTPPHLHTSIALSFFQPNAGPDRPCPICGRPRPHSERYPDAVCADCVDRATDDAGRRLVFSNLFPESLGGFRAQYADTAERLDTPDDRCECLIDGVWCVAREAYFGGIVVQPLEERK